MTVELWQVWLDVVDGSPVHQVGTLDLEAKAFFAVESCFHESYRRQPDIVWTEWRSGGKHSLPHVSAKTGRTHRGVFLCVHIFRESPYYPYIVETIKPPDRFGVLVFLVEHYRSAQAAYDAALAGYAELGGERRTEVCYRLDIHLFFLY